MLSGLLVRIVQENLFLIHILRRKMGKFVDIFGMIIYCFLVLILVSAFVFMMYLLWLEYKLEKGIADETYAHNGTCISHGFYRECSYQGDKTTIINSNSKCLINDVEVNCSEIK